MYPNTFLNLFPPFPRDNRVFVAMSFDPMFDLRWKNVISPAIKNVHVNKIALEPYRVDIRHISDSILTEILDGIGNNRLVIADVTTIAYASDMPVRNANVMYEVGLAHAMRLPEEVILFRSDKDGLLFDVANIRVNYYNPDNDPAKAKKLVSEVISEALNEIELNKHLAVKKASESLDFVSWNVLLEADINNGITPPITKKMGQILANIARQSAISRLLDMGALTTSYLTITPEIIKTQAEAPPETMLKYHITPFGEAIMKHTGEKMGMNSPGMQPIFEKLSSEIELPEKKQTK